MNSTHVTVNGKTYTASSIDFLLRTNDIAVERALVRLFEKQTQYEKASDTTNVNNKVGFSQCDARMFSSFAKWVLRGRRLTPKQLAYARRPWGRRGKPTICKYANQIFNMMLEESNS